MQNTALVLDLFERVKGAGAILYLDDGNLKLRFKKGYQVPNQLIDEIKKHKEGIIELLPREVNALENDELTTQLVAYDRTTRGPIPLSFSQKRLWFVDKLEGSIHYHIPVLREIIGDFNTDAFRRAWKSIVARYEIFRTVFREMQADVYQEVLPADGWNVNCVDASSWSNDEIIAWVSNEIQKPFDLSNDYLVRVYALSLGNQRTGIVVNYHHVVIDGWSMPQVEGECIELYNAYSTGREPQLTPVKFQYLDYAVWQNQYLKGKLFEKKLNWWVDYLAGVRSLDLPLDYPRKPVPGTQGANHCFVLDAQLSERLNELSRNEGATLFMTCFAGFNTLLHRYSGQDDICVGTPVANRMHKDTESIVGFFVNSMALRMNFNGDPSFRSLLKQLKDRVLVAYQLQDVPIDSIIERVVNKRERGFRPLFHVMFMLQNTPAPLTQNNDEAKADIEMRSHAFGKGVAKFDITFIVTNTPDGIAVNIEYCVDLFKAETIERMAGHFTELMRSITTSPDMAVSRLPMLTGLEKNILLEGFNTTSINAPGNTVLELFNEQVQKTPDAMAVIFEEAGMSYKQLDAQSNRLAHYLRENGVGKETVVALSIEHSTTLVVCLLAILKSGGAYVGIDPGYPADRKRFILEDSGAAIMLGDNSSFEQLASPARFISIDSILETLKRYPADETGVTVSPDQLAYVIYTSGSSGKPKGVMITHGSLADYASTFKRHFKIDGSDKVIQQSSISFDTIVEEIYPALISGASVMVTKEGGKDIRSLVDCIERDGATILTTTPSVLEALGKRLNNTCNLRYVISGGELLRSEQIEPFFGKVAVVNSYGPSESTVCATYHTIEDPDEAAIIGRAIDNREVYIMSPQLELVAIGQKGEICIGGAGLARGYLGNQELTDEKFADHPFKSGRKLYRTGDYGKYLADGRIVFLGRSDDQVKFRGYRIELGEIENNIREHSNVKDCAVIVWTAENGVKHLVAYVVPANEFNQRDLQSFVAGRLPSYMNPTLWVMLDRIPLNVNNKVDKKALPEPDGSRTEALKSVAPRTDIEEKLLGIWQEVLEIKAIGMHDNFFELGGHSLKVMEVIYRIEDVLSVKVPVKAMFEAATIEVLATYIVRQHNLIEKEVEYI